MLTPPQVQDLIDHFGSQSATARAVGVSAPTVRYWLNPERARRTRREARRRNPEYRERERQRSRDRYYQNLERERAIAREYQRKRRQDPEYAERNRERLRRRYWNMSGVEHSRELLRKRRSKALRRKAKRQQQRETHIPEVNQVGSV